VRCDGVRKNKLGGWVDLGLKNKRSGSGLVANSGKAPTPTGFELGSSPLWSTELGWKYTRLAWVDAERKFTD
jgi:hypothetical protein